MKPRDMSHSGSPELDDDRGMSENLDHSGDERRGSKPGRKKNPNTAAARRDQNRIAQREFRLRKQQKIRDLEARVELLSGNKDEMYGQLRTMLRVLMEENSQLRGLLREMGKWIGEGSGGPLATHLGSIGWQMNQFQAFLNHTETDTAFEIFSSLKKQKGANGVGPSSSAANGLNEGLAATDEPGDGSSHKRRRLSESTGATALNMMHDSSQYVQSSVNGPADATSFASFLGGQSFRSPSSNIPGGSVPSSTDPQVQATSLLGLAHVAESSVPLGLPDCNSFPTFSIPQMGAFGTTTAGSSVQPQTPSTSQSMDSGPLFGDEAGVVDDGLLLRKNEAGRLFKYHLDNFRRNPSYCLPRILNPTLVQRTIPHEPIIDSVPFADLRDRMILLKDRFSLADVLHQMFLNTTIHGDDILQQSNWELHKPWMERYPYLVAESTLAVANKWRRERGEAEIAMAELNGEG